MRSLSLMILSILALASAAGAQLQNGHLVFSVSDANLNNGYTAYMDPSNPGSPTTLAVAPSGSFHNWVRMAPNNTDLVFTRVGLGANPLGDLVNVQTNGVLRTIATFPGFITDGYELDHDGQWILSARIFPSDPRHNFLLGVDHVSGAVTTFASLQTSTYFNEMTIDRDPGSVPYVFVTCCLSGTSGPEVLKADRRGSFVTLVGGTGIQSGYAIELDPRTGDYIGQFTSGIIRMNKAGGKTTLTAFAGNAIKILQDDTAWIAGASSLRTFLRYDLSQNAVVTTVPSPAGWSLMSVEVYGSRPLVCNQPPATPRVTVNVHSQHPQAGGASYVLAASVARRLGLKFANGEWLHLDVSHPLFYTSALGLAPGIFVNFQGQLNAFGSTTATVNIPPGLPPLNDMAIFVAGVIYKDANIIQVTNTHWFVL